MKHLATILHSYLLRVFYKSNQVHQTTTESLETTHRRVSDQAISDALPFGKYRTLPGLHYDSLGSLFPEHPKLSRVFDVKREESEK